MGTYRQTNDSNRCGKDNAEPFPHRLSPYLWFWVAALTLGVWSMFLWTEFLLPYTHKNKNDPHIWASLRGLAGSRAAKIRIIIHNTNFLYLKIRKSGFLRRLNVKIGWYWYIFRINLARYDKISLNLQWLSSLCVKLGSLNVDKQTANAELKTEKSKQLSR